MKRFSLTIIALVSLGVPAGAVKTETWLHATRQDFAKGRLENLSLRSDGVLSLAPANREVFDSSTAAIWALAEDSQGNIYAGGGGPGARSAKVFRIRPDGSAETVAELDGLQVQALAINSKDEVFAATAPDGKVYRIAPGAKPAEFYDPKTKYIWALVAARDGSLYVATGDKGEIHRVAPDGSGEVFFRTGETHVRSLIFDAEGNLIAGTDPGGLIFRITPAGEGFVLYQSAKREVTALAASEDGTIYAAAVGAKKRAVPRPTLTPTVTPVRQQPAAGPSLSPQAPSSSAAAQTTRRLMAAIPGLRTGVSGGSELIVIEPDGYPRVVWSDKEAIVYSIALDDQGRPIFGAGNKGRIYRLENHPLYTMLLDLPPTQVTALLPCREGGLYAATSNIGKLYHIGPGLASEGSYVSEVLDAEQFSYWGRIRFRGRANGGSIELAARSGNLDRPQQNWSPWKPVRLESDGGRAEAPPARFLQYRVTLKASRDGASPEVAEVEAAYLNKNVAPEVKKIAATPPNYRFLPQTLKLTQSRNITLPPLTGSPRPSAKTLTTSSSQTMRHAKGYVGVRWLAEDPNGDKLRYRVEIRGEGETEWKLLEEELDKAYLSWDSTAYADGEYRVRVTATDAPDNPPHQALEATLVSEPFLIDNTPPEIRALAATFSGGVLTARWKAADARTVIRRAEYSLDGGEWTIVEPLTRLSDSRELDYELKLEEIEPGEHTLAVRVTDAFDNQGVAKVVVR